MTVRIYEVQAATAPAISAPQAGVSAKAARRAVAVQVPQKEQLVLGAARAVSPAIFSTRPVEPQEAADYGDGVLDVLSEDVL